MDTIQTYEDLRSALSSLKSGECLTLKRNAEYHVYQDNCPVLYGYHASNTASYEENPNGERFTAIHLKDLKNVTINGNGASIIIHGIMTPFLFDSCENVTVKDLTVDYARHTMNEYTVESSSKGSSILRMGEDGLYEVKDGKLYFLGDNDKNGIPYWRTEAKGKDLLSMYFDPKTEHVKFLSRESGDRFPSIPTAERVEDLGDRRIKMTWSNRDATLPEGCVIQTRDVRRIQLGGLFQYCKDLRLENMTIRFMHGFGLLCQYCESVTFSGLDCTPSEGHTIACNADFFHFSGCRGNITVENCRAAGAHDDFVNVHGTHLRVVARDDNKKSLLLRFENPNTWGIRAFTAGDRIEFINSKTLLPYASRKVKAVEQISNTDIRIFLNNIPKEIDLGNDAVENVTWTPRLTVKNNSFGPSMGRGVLCTTRKKIRILNNRFYKLGGSVLVVADDCNFWMESGYTRDILFKNNTLIDCGYGVGSHPAPLICVKPEVSADVSCGAVHKKLRITGNRIVGEKNTFQGNVYFSIEQVTEDNNIIELTEEY